MEIFSVNQNLKDYNTFGIDVKARYFYSFTHTDELKNFIKHLSFSIEKKLILGGGSNILFLNDFDGLIIHPLIKGINIVKQTAEHIYICAGAGENWDDFVNFCVINNYGGTENLSLIPGTVGAAPVQNIGAYGVEVKNFIVEVTGLNLETFEEKKLSAVECNFGYRTSIFKNKL
ncbi:MAG: FAD-binding protein, partial [Bacteroidia bacterium]|nr:FAD-binding protein [Bacteroidia bacterium]